MFEPQAVAPARTEGLLEQDVEIDSPTPRSNRAGPSGEFAQPLQSQPHLTPEPPDSRPHAPRTGRTTTDEAGVHGPSPGPSRPQNVVPIEDAIPAHAPESHSPSPTPDPPVPAAEPRQTFFDVLPASDHGHSSNGDHNADNKETIVRERLVQQSHIRTEVNSKTLVETHHFERQARSNSATGPRRDSRQKTEPPEINISIGRIEVRASVSAPTSTASPRSKAPQLGLDAYLKSRSGVNR